MTRPTIAARNTVLALLACVGTWALAQGSATGEGRTLVVSQLDPAASDDNSGTAEEPFRSIARAAREVQPGDTVLIESGVYRETVTIETSGTPEQPIVFQAAPLAQVVVTGADVLTDWRREEGTGNVFSTPWPYVFIGWSPTRNHPADEYHQLIGRAEQVFADGYPLLQVGTRQELTRGTFFVDEPGQRLYVWLRTNEDLLANPGWINMEGSVRSVLWDCRGDFITARGIRFRYAANQAQSGSVILRGEGDVLEDCVVEQMNATGVSLLGPRQVLRRCIIRDNGQQGFSGTARDLLITGCVCENNNVKNYSRGWEAGGNKLVLCANAVLESSIFRRNHGTGIWFDIGNESCTVRNCLIADNEDAGIFYEISYGLHAHDNVIVGNGAGGRFEAWGANGGISLSSSSGCVVERNLLIANREGFQFREQGRTTLRIGRGGESFAIWNHGHTIRNNLIAGNRDLQVGGWFDVLDASHWPRAMQAEKAEIQLPPPDLIPAVADLDLLPQRPQGMALEDLGLNLTGNLYATSPGQGLYQWGCAWRKHERYRAIEEVQQRLGLEAGSRIGTVEFADWPSLGLRVPANSLAIKMGCYPRGEVPGVRLGVL